MSQVESMTHDEIADFIAMRLRKMGYPLSLSNITSVNIGEQPDVLGVGLCGKSIVVEVKVSRADFHADKKKPWRKPGNGMGDRRVYVTPKGLLKPSDIPYGWMLWEVHGKTKPMIKIIKGKKMVRESDPRVPWTTAVPTYLNCDLDEYMHFEQDYKTKNYRSELIIAVEVMRRAAESGIELNDFANKYQIATQK